MKATFQPREFLNSVACLQKHGDDAEDVGRTIAGRAYYAVYGTFKSRMGNGNLQHAGLRAALAERSRAAVERKKWQDIRDKTDYLWKLRRKSDYHYREMLMQEPMQKLRIQMAVKFATELIPELEQIERATMTKLYRRAVELEKARVSGASAPAVPDGYWA